MTKALPYIAAILFLVSIAPAVLLVWAVEILVCIPLLWLLDRRHS